MSRLLAKRIDRRTLLQGLLVAALPLSVVAAESETLRAVAAKRNLLVGSAVSNRQLYDAAVRALLIEQLSVVVPENEMKWDAVHPEPDRYQFAAADQLVEFAQQNGLLVRGHNLCWHESQPAWLAAVANSQNATALLREHIATVAGRYSGRIHSWDVVNEAIEPGDKQAGGLRNTNWLRLLGPDYIGIAFRAAAKADPQALLTYNDYGLETDELRQEAALNLLHWMRRNQIPIHALGLQSHLTASYDEIPDWSGLHNFLKKVAKLNCRVFVTELDVDDNGLDGSLQHRAKESAWLCGDYLKAVLQHSNVAAILTWGLVSHGTYRAEGFNAHRSLPFAADLEPAPFFGAMQDALVKRRS